MVSQDAGPRDWDKDPSNPEGLSGPNACSFIVVPQGPHDIGVFSLFGSGGRVFSSIMDKHTKVGEENLLDSSLGLRHCILKVAVNLRPHMRSLVGGLMGQNV